MAIARLRANWDETAALLACVVNTAGVFAGAKDTVDPAEINPYRKDARRAEGEAAPVLSREEAVELFKALAGKK